MSFYGYAPYVPVAQRRAKALKQLEKMRKKGLNVQPVEIAGRKIAVSFWGKGWCDHIESFSDYANRLPRGRTYVRNGSVCHLEISSGQVMAIVSGSSLYNVSITIAPLVRKRWDAVRSACSGRIGSLIDLLRGKLESSVMEVVTDRKNGLFPLSGEIKFDCDCPDWAGMCKHIAAVLYGVGARLDHSPEMLFLLRGVNHEELVDVTAAVAAVGTAGTSRRRIAATGIADVFGIDMDEAGDPLPAEPVVARKKSKAESRVTAPVKAKEILTPAGRKRAAAKTPQQKKTMPDPPFPSPLTGDAIYSWRSSLGLTQVQFAARVGVAAPSVCQWEKKGETVIGMQSRTLARLIRGWQLTH